MELYKTPMKKIFTLLVFLFAALNNLMAQNNTSTEVEMADQMRAEGKIYVVVAVILIVFVGLILYLISLDSKISKIEKEKASFK